MRIRTKIAIITRSQPYHQPPQQNHQLHYQQTNKLLNQILNSHNSSWCLDWHLHRWYSTRLYCWLWGSLLRENCLITKMVMVVIISQDYLAIRTIALVIVIIIASISHRLRISSWQKLQLIIVMLMLIKTIARIIIREGTIPLTKIICNMGIKIKLCHQGEWPIVIINNIKNNNNSLFNHIKINNNNNNKINR